MATMPGTDESGQGTLGGAKAVSFGGLFFVAFATVVFAVAAFRLVQSDLDRLRGWEGYIPEVLLCGIAVFGALLGVSLLRAGGLVATQPNRVINSKEWDAVCDKVREGDEQAINQYIRLTGLTGFTGIFTKLGLTGLPLATIGLTLVFSAMYSLNAEFMDLAKLTLGAFIGSFVQKQVGAQGGGTVKLPTGETIKFSSSEPPLS